MGGKRKSIRCWSTLGREKKNEEGLLLEVTSKEKDNSRQVCMGAI